MPCRATQFHSIPTQDSASRFRCYLCLAILCSSFAARNRPKQCLCCTSRSSPPPRPCVSVRVHSVPHAAIPLPFCSSPFAPLPLLHVTNPRIALAFLYATTLYFAIPLPCHAVPRFAAALLNIACLFSATAILFNSLLCLCCACRCPSTHRHCFSGRIEATHFDAQPSRVTASQYFAFTEQNMSKPLHFSATPISAFPLRC